MNKAFSKQGGLAIHFFRAAGAVGGGVMTAQSVSYPLFASAPITATEIFLSAGGAIVGLSVFIYSIYRIKKAEESGKSIGYSRPI